MDSRFKVTLENQLKEEMKKNDEMLASDINGKRVSLIYTSKMQEKMNEIAQITDTQVLLTNTISLLRSSASILDAAINEVNISRREQKSRVNSLKDYYTKFIEIEEIIKTENEVSQHNENDFNFDNENNKSQQVRRIGERPEKLKSIRNEEN
jgi:hypothetical protein